MLNNKQTYTVEQATKKLEAYCAYQERSHYQVEKKLREMQMIPEVIDHIVLHLIKHNFLNEERFAQSYARGKFYQKQWGKQKIIQGLKQHHIHQKLIDKALQEIDNQDYTKTIRNLIDKKNKEYKINNPYQKKQKISRYLYQKGYRFDEFVDFL